jgi:hypothetical protein
MKNSLRNIAANSGLAAGFINVYLCFPSASARPIHPLGPSGDQKSAKQPGLAPPPSIHSYNRFISSAICGHE